MVKIILWTDIKRNISRLKICILYIYMGQKSEGLALLAFDNCNYYKKLLKPWGLTKQYSYGFSSRQTFFEKNFKSAINLTFLRRKKRNLR